MRGRDVPVYWENGFVRATGSDVLVDLTGVDPGVAPYLSLTESGTRALIQRLQYALGDVAAANPHPGSDHAAYGCVNCE